MYFVCSLYVVFKTYKVHIASLFLKTTELHTKYIPYKVHQFYVFFDEIVLNCFAKTVLVIRLLLPGQKFLVRRTLLTVAKTFLG